jgi:CHAT domain
VNDYHELEITIEKDRASFRVEKRDYEGQHALTREKLEELNGLRRAGSAAEYGEALFRALFCGELEDGYRAARQEILQARARWRVRLRVAEDASELHCLWWESLYDPTPPPRPLARWRETPLSRYLGREAKDPIRAERIKVLAAISSPSDLESGIWAKYPKLDEDAEKGVLESAFKKVDDRVDLKFQTKPASFKGIRSRLKEEDFHVLHIVAHGALTADGEGCLLLEKEDETTRPLSYQSVGELVDDLPALQLVVLAVCHSAQTSGTNVFVGLAQQMIHYGVPAVVAMQDRVSEDTARVFTEKFYRALGSGDTSGGMIDAALNWARDELYTEVEEKKGWDWAIPVLFMRGDGRLFDLEGASSDSDGTAASSTTATTPRTSGTEASATVPRPSSTTISASEPTKVEAQGDLQVNEAEEAVALYGAMAMQLERDQLTTICKLLWSTSFDDLPGGNEDEKLLFIVNQCRDNDQIDLLWRLIKMQLNLVEKRAREEMAEEAAEAAKILDFARARAGRAS